MELAPLTIQGERRMNFWLDYPNYKIQMTASKIFIAVI